MKYVVVFLIASLYVSGALTSSSKLQAEDDTPNMELDLEAFEEDQPQQFRCQHGGYYRRDCYSFYHCANGVPHLKQCAPGTCYNSRHAHCDHCQDVPECYHS